MVSDARSDLSIIGGSEGGKAMDVKDLCKGDIVAFDTILERKVVRRWEMDWERSEEEEASGIGRQGCLFSDDVCVFDSPFIVVGYY